MLGVPPTITAKLGTPTKSILWRRFNGFYGAPDNWHFVTPSATCPKGSSDLTRSVELAASAVEGAWVDWAAAQHLEEGSLEAGAAADLGGGHPYPWGINRP